MPKPIHRSYSVFQAWRIVRRGDLLVVEPSLVHALAPALLPLAAGVVLGCFLKRQLIAIGNAGFLLVSVTLGIIVLIVMLCGFVRWTVTRRGGLPYLKVSKSMGFAELPRHDLRLQVGDTTHTFVHERFIGSDSFSEFNLVKNLEGEEDSISVLRDAFPTSTFEKLGAELERCGFRFVSRETRLGQSASKAAN